MKKSTTALPSSGARLKNIGQKASKLFLLFGLGVSFQGCQKEDILKESSYQATSFLISPESMQLNELQTKFAKTLATALKAEPALRVFLKEEANKKFNGDADVLYYFVKDKPVAGGATFRQHLARYTSTEELAGIEEKSPLLTIFIPDLPNGFSPETWNAFTEVPVVAVRLRGSNTIPYYNAEGKEEIVPKGAIPGFPTIVIKQNERVTTAPVQPKEENLEFYRGDKFTFSFIDKNFDNVHAANHSSPEKGNKKNTGNRIGFLNGGIDPKVSLAYTYNGSDPNIQWQRDYVYYNITPTNPNGPLDRNYREVIRSITFTEAALGKMSDQTEDGSLKDPAFQPAHGWYEQNPNWWTDGNFELQVSVLINANNGIGPTIRPILPINPRDIFDVTYERRGFFLYPTAITPKQYDILMSLVPWDLQIYGTGWHFVFVERDNSGTKTYSVQNTSSFGTNFSFDPTFSATIKGGAKFGFTTSNSTTVTHSVTLNLDDDELCVAPMTFDRPIIKTTGNLPFLNNSPIFITEELNNGPNSYISASIEPMRF
jgi:hypothetical protein